MRPLHVEPMADVPSFVQGVAIIRGIPTPVVDAAVLVSGAPSRPTRFVVLRTGSRRTALAVDAVLGVFEFAPGAVRALPPLVEGASQHALAAIGVLDSELLFVLRDTRLAPEDVWATLRDRGPSA